MRYIGVDLHKSTFYVCSLDLKDNRKYRQYRMEDLEEFIAGLQSEDLVAVESTGNARYFAEQLRSHVKEVKVVNPSQFKVIKNSIKKTDKHDAELLALFLSRGMLPEIRVPEALQAQLKSLAQTRDKLVKLRTTLKNKIHNILNGHGIVSKREDFTSEKGLSRALSYPVSELAKIEMQVIVEQIRHLNQGIAKLDDQLREKGKKLKGFKNLTSIKGIGEKSATILLSVIGNIEDFEDEKKLSAYFGMVPRVSSSNQTVHQGRITKHGSKLGRTTLVQCCLIAKRYSPYLAKFYNNIKQRKGSGKAIIATARKLLTIIFYTLKNNWIFEDFPNFVIQQG